MASRVRSAGRGWRDSLREVLGDGESSSQLRLKVVLSLLCRKPSMDRHIARVASSFCSTCRFQVAAFVLALVGVAE